MSRFDLHDVNDEALRAFVDQTIHVAPSLKPIFDEHVADNDEILAHVYFGDVSRWFVGEVTVSGPSDEAVALLELIETSYVAADISVQNLIDVSFVEMVQDEPSVVALFGPNLLSHVDEPYRPRA